MSYETLAFAVNDGLATITLTRSEQANALNLKMAEELHAVSILCSTRADVRAVLLTGEGRMFCAGGDLKQFNDAGDGREALVLNMATILHAAIIRFSNMDAPLVIALNGAAGGAGLSLLSSADFVIASSKAKLVSAYTASGLTPDGSSTFFHAKHIGLLRAKELMFTNRVLTADEAKDWGLVNQVVEPEVLADEAVSVARNFAAGPTKAFGRLKRLLQTAYSDPMESQLEQETQAIAWTMTTEDGPHGIESFLEKRKPEFKGR